MSLTFTRHPAPHPPPGINDDPDMFKTKPKRPHAPILMHTDKNEKPRLGRSKGREVNGAKPYAGEGGMKKLLARRKQEEEEERKQEKADAMDDGSVEEDEMPARRWVDHTGPKQMEGKRIR